MGPRSVLGNDDVENAAGHQLLDGEPQNPFPSGVDLFKNTVESRDKEHFQRLRKKPLIIQSIHGLA